VCVCVYLCYLCKTYHACVTFMTPFVSIPPTNILFLYVCIYVQVFVCVSYMCQTYHVCTYAHVYVCMYVCMCIRVHVGMCMCVLCDVYMTIYIYIYTYVNLCKIIHNIHTYI
jgi:hypothetical protein